MTAVVFHEDKPLLELTAEEFVFPVLTPDEQFTVLFHMKPYRASEVKRFYSDLVYPKRERVGSELVFKQQEYADLKLFVDRHFIGMGGVLNESGEAATLDEQREWLKEHPEFKVAVFRQGYDAIAAAASSATGNGLAATPKGLVLFRAEDHQVGSEWKLWSVERNEKTSVVVHHHLARFSQPDRHRYTSSIKFCDNTRRGEQYIETNWDVVEQLYDQKVKKLDGALVDGKPCDESNKAVWLPLVPFTMKVFVVGEVMSELEIKNA